MYRKTPRNVPTPPPGMYKKPPRKVPKTPRMYQLPPLQPTKMYQNESPLWVVLLVFFGVFWYILRQNRAVFSTKLGICWYSPHRGGIQKCPTPVGGEGGGTIGHPPPPPHPPTPPNYHRQNALTSVFADDPKCRIMAYPWGEGAGVENHPPKNSGTPPPRREGHTLRGGVLALRAALRLDSPMKNPHTDTFQTPSKLGHPSYPNAPKFGSPKLP